MASGLIRRRQRAPLQPLRVNASHPLASGLGFFGWALGVNRIWNALTGRIIDLSAAGNATGTFLRGAGDHGPTLRMTGSQRGGGTIYNPTGATLGQGTLVARFAPSQATGGITRPYVLIANAGLGRGLLLGMAGATSSHAWGVSSSNGWLLPAGSGVDEQVWRTVGVNRTPGVSQSVDGWLDGRAQGSAVHTGTDIAGDTPVNIWIGRDPTNYYGYPSGDVGWIGYWHRVLSAAEHRLLHEDAWSLAASPSLVQGWHLAAASAPPQPPTDITGKGGWPFRSAWLTSKDGGYGRFSLLYAGLTFSNSDPEPWLDWTWGSAGPATYNEAAFDSVTAGDSAAGGLAVYDATSDSAAAGDGGAAAATHRPAISDAAAASDSTAVVDDVAAGTTDAAAAGEAVSAVLLTSPAVSDAATADDSAADGLALPGAISDAAATTDAVSPAATAAAPISDSASTGDSCAATAILVAGQTDTVVAGDGVAGASVTVPTGSDTTTATDATGAAATFVASLSDAAAAGDAAASTTSGSTEGISDSAAAGEAFAVTVQAQAPISESAAAADVGTGALTTGASISESTTAADSVAAAATGAANVGDAVTAGDAAESSQVGAGSTISDAVAAGDGVGGLLVGLPFISDPVLAVDAADALATFPVGLLDVVAAMDWAGGTTLAARRFDGEAQARGATSGSSPRSPGNAAQPRH